MRRVGRRALGFDFREEVLGGREFYMNWAARYASSFNTGSDLDPEKQQNPFVVVNAAMGIAAARGVEFEVFARNLTDAEIIQVAFDAPLQAGSFGAFLAEPRTYGVTARVRF